MNKDIKKALEHCINNECVGCPNNEELGSGDIVCRGRLLPEVIEYVADLEAKLTESERKNFELLTKLNLKEYAPAFCTLADRDCEALGQIEELKQQLEEENQQLKEQLSKKEETLKHIMSGEYIPANIAEKTLKLSEQSQKQLAIEELEKLKDFFLEPYKDEEMDTDYIITKDAGEIADYILDQIKQLKEGN